MRMPWLLWCYCYNTDENGVVAMVLLLNYRSECRGSYGVIVTLQMRMPWLLWYYCYNTVENGVAAMVLLLNYT